jgi:hypothetical protein
MFFDIIHRPLFIQKPRPVYFPEHNVSETGFCLRLQVKHTQLGPIDRANPYLWTNKSSSSSPTQILCAYSKGESYLLTHGAEPFLRSGQL